jgi:hypothetical protein
LNQIHSTVTVNDNSLLNIMPMTSCCTINWERTQFKFAFFLFFSLQLQIQQVQIQEALRFKQNGILILLYLLSMHSGKWTYFVGDITVSIQ